MYLPDVAPSPIPVGIPATNCHSGWSAFCPVGIQAASLSDVSLVSVENVDEFYYPKSLTVTSSMTHLVVVSPLTPISRDEISRYIANAFQ